MGNAIQKRFNLPTNHTATAGHVNNWKIWPGKGKDGGQQLVSIWAFDKTDLTKRKHNPVADKTIVEQVFQIMKRDFTVIKDSKACSNIIQILEVVEESKNSIAFTTERIVCSLADVLNNFENIPGGAAEHSSFFESGAALSEMEITRGLLNITLALQYLHTVQRKLHLNLTPEDIVITATGQWKLCGFGFALAFLQGETQRLASPYFMQASPITTTSLVSRLEPDLRYAAPECTEGGFNPPGVRYLTPVADMFSLGLVFYEIYRFNLKLTPPERSYSRPLLMITNNDAMQHLHALAILQGTDYSFMPQGAASIVSSLMNTNAQFRGTTTDIVNNAYFVTGAQAVLNMIESMHTRDLGTQSSQLLSLQPDLVNFPPRMLIHSVIPAISRLCINAPNLWVYALPLHAELSGLLTQDKYVYFAGPYLAQGLNNLEAPNDTLQVFLSSVQFICRYFGSDFFQANVTTLFCNALEKPNLYLQNLALEKLSEQYVYTLFTTPTLVDRLMPILCKIACKNPEPSVKIQSLYIISLLTHKLDEAYVAKNILASLKYIADHEKNPQVSMSVVGNFESISNSLGLTYVATSVLPILQNMLLDPGLDRLQFEIVVNMIKRLLKKILDKRTEELKMPSISIGEVHGSEVVDPFTTAKQLIQQSKDKNIASNYGLITGSYKLFSGERINTATNSGANSAYTVTAPAYSATSSAAFSVPVNSNGLAPANMESGKINLSAYESSSYGATNNSSSSGIIINSAGHVAPPAPSVPPPAPSKAPPPPPSAPPPSHIPSSLPVAGTVGGFGSDVYNAQKGPAAVSSVGYGSTSSSLPPATPYGGSYGSSTASNTAATATITGGGNNNSGIGTSGYQPNFNNSSSSATASGGYGTPLTPLDGGLPGFGSTSALTPVNSSIGNTSATTANDAEKKSMFSFFSGSKKPEQKDTLMDASGADLYKPPVVSGASYNSTTSGNVGSNSGTGGGVPDLDDFLSSFGNNAPANSLSGANTMGGVKPATVTPAYSSSSSNMNTAPSSASYSAPYSANANMSTKSTSSLGSTASGLSIEQQIAQAQQEIARLSATNTTNTTQPTYGAPVSSGYTAPAAYTNTTTTASAQSSAWPTQLTTSTQPTQPYGYGANSTIISNNGMNPNMYANNNMVGVGGYVPPQPYTNQYANNSSSYVPPGANTYTPPAAYGAPNATNMYSQGAIPGYSYNPNNMGSNMGNNMGNNNMNQGYMPPQQAGNVNYGAPKPKTDVFDFLN